MLSKILETKLSIIKIIFFTCLFVITFNSILYFLEKFVYGDRFLFDDLVLNYCAGILYSQNMPGISGELIASAPLLLGVIRLAHYNINENEDSSYFEGLPTTFNAIFICSLILYIENIKAIAPEYSQPRFLLPIIISSSFLMISRIKYPKFPLLNFHSGKLNSIGLVIVISILFIFLISILFNQQEMIFMLFSSGLIIFGLFNYLFINEKMGIFCSSIAKQKFLFSISI